MEVPGDVCQCHSTPVNYNWICGFWKLKSRRQKLFIGIGEFRLKSQQNGVPCVPSRRLRKHDYRPILSSLRTAFQKFKELSSVTDTCLNYAITFTIVRAPCILVWTHPTSLGCVHIALARILPFVDERLSATLLSVSNMHANYTGLLQFKSLHCSVQRCLLMYHSFYHLCAVNILCITFTSRSAECITIRKRCQCRQNCPINGALMTKLKVAILVLNFIHCFPCSY